MPELFPFVETLPNFLTLAKLGNDLIEAHLLDNKFIESIKQNYPKFDIIGEGSFEITKIDFIENKVWINKNQYFSNISQSVWNFKIGTFFPIQKYLKDRKGEKIGLENLTEIENQIIAISFTIEKMNELELLTNNLL